MAHKSKSHKHHDKSKRKTAGSHRSSRRRSPSPQGSGAEDVQYDSDWYPELEQAISADIHECMELKNKLLNVVVADSSDSEEEEEEEEKQPEEEQQQEEKKKEKKKSRKTKHKHRSREKIDESTERKDCSPEGKDGSKEHKHRSKERKHRPKEHTNDSTEGKDCSSECKECSSERNDSSKKHKPRSKEHADHSEEPKDRSKKHKGHSKEHKDCSKEHTDHSKEHKHRSKEHKHRSKEHKHRFREHTDGSTEGKEGSSEHRDSSKKHKHRSREHADHSTERKDRSKEHKDLPKEHKDRPKEHKDHSKEHKHRSSEHLKHSTGRKDRSKKHKESEGVVVPLPRKFPPHIIKCDDGRVIVIDEKGEYGLGLDFTEGARIWAAQREQEKSSSTSVDRTAPSTTTSNRGEEDAERRVTFDLESSAESSDWYVSKSSATETNPSDASGWSASDSSAKTSDPSSSDQSNESWTAAMKAWPTTKPWFEEDEKDKEEVKAAQPGDFTWSFSPAGITIPPEIPHPVEELTRRSNRNISSAGTMNPPKTHVPAEAQSSGSIWRIPASNITNPPKVPCLVKAAKYDWKDDWTSTSYSSCTPSVSTVTDSYGSSELSGQADSTWEISSTIASVDSNSEDDNDTIVPFSWHRKLENESIYSEAGSTNPPEPSDAGSGLSWGDGNEKKNGHKKKASTWSTISSEDQAQYGGGGWDSQSSWGGNIKLKDGYKSQTRRQGSTTPIRQPANGEEESGSQYSWGGKVKQKPLSRISSFSNYKAPYVEDGSDSTEKKKGKPKADDQKPINGPKDKKKSRKYSGWSEEYSTPTSWRDV